MRRDLLPTFALVVGLLLFAVVIGALVRMPYRGPVWVVHVDTEMETQ